MSLQKTRYPFYNVLQEKSHWDEHTREIVLKRLGPFTKYEFLNNYEVEILYAMAKLVVNEERQEILEYLVHQLDKNLASPIGEDQRKIGVPEQKILIRQGLLALNQAVRQQYSVNYVELGSPQQLAFLNDLQKGKATLPEKWQEFPQQDFFKKLAADLISFYYSHPVIWSEIGYGGPAYPRGYVRVEKGLADPWEAKRDDREP